MFIWRKLICCPFHNHFKNLNLALGLMESHRIGYAVGIDCEKEKKRDGAVFYVIFWSCCWKSIVIFLSKLSRWLISWK